jgi:hypothetical protein
MPQVLKHGGKNLNSENWKVYHPNGKHMFTCGERKATWYLEKLDENGVPLAKKVGEFEIQFNFEPKGDGYKEGDVFGLAGREMRCVVNGEEDGLQRHHIVPYCYRSHFPVEYKSKNHHDVVLITYKYHEAYEVEATKFKNKVAEMYGIKTLNQLNLEYTKVLCQFSDTKVKTVSKLYSIFGSYGKIPQEVVNSNLMFVADQIGLSRKFISSLNYIQLYKLYLEIKKEYQKEFDAIKAANRKEYDHGYHLMQKLKTHEDIEEFVKMWRAHFVQTMKPKYMPEGWSIDFRVKVEI